MNFTESWTSRYTDCSVQPHFGPASWRRRPWLSTATARSTDLSRTSSMGRHCRRRLMDVTHELVSRPHMPMKDWWKAGADIVGAIGLKFTDMQPYIPSLFDHAAVQRIARKARGATLVRWDDLHTKCPKGPTLIAWPKDSYCLCLVRRQGQLLFRL